MKTFLLLTTAAFLMLPVCAHAQSDEMKVIDEMRYLSTNMNPSVLDKNKDGALSKEEFFAYHEQYFKGVDADDNGSITQEELSKKREDISKAMQAESEKRRAESEKMREEMQKRRAEMEKNMPKKDGAANEKPKTPVGALDKTPEPDTEKKKAE